MTNHCLAFCLALLATAGVSAGEAAMPPLPAIATVVTWADLWKQPQHDLGGGTSARFGIEALHAPVGGGVLVYCLAEGPALQGEIDGDDWIGPARFAVRVTGAADELKALSRQMLPLAKVERKSLLYLRTIPIALAGQHVLTISTADQRPLLRATIAGADDARPGWMMLGDAGIGGGPGRVVGLARGPAALPRWDGLLPAAVVALAPVEAIADTPEQAALRGQPLPRLLPERPDPGLVLAGDAKALTLSADPALTILAIAEAHDQFLVRWWLDDQPLAPESLAEIIRNGSSTISDQKRLTFVCDLRALGAQSGQRVGVQLLYCLHGRMGVFAGLQVPIDEHIPSPSAPVRMSNRVDFDVP